MQVENPIEAPVPLRDVVIVGSGNVAESLARAVAVADGLRLVQIVARNAARGAALAALTGTRTTADSARCAAADLYLVAVSDRAVAEATAELRVPAHAVVAHTAGSVPIKALARFPRRGVFYPLQTFTRGRAVDFSGVPCFIEGSDECAALQLDGFARRLGASAFRADSARRRTIHLAGVFACNFANAMYAAGERVLADAELPFEVLKPLIAETAAKAADASTPVAVQTGPAVRGDAPTLDRHRAMLAANPELEAIYTEISRYIWEISRKI